ncbi:HAD-IA family hydrolase [Flagellimonas sp. DF-77]|uniref:HAD-IA family hydrolase n=1 Tax=Flagellimonas algarum TaxID=3230298 RepID=UPI0033980B2F
MIRNIIFDFGDIFIDLDKPATLRMLKHFGYDSPTSAQQDLFNTYEKGLVSTSVFLERMHGFFPTATKEELITGWNSILKDFPDHRLDFIVDLAKTGQHRLFLLSNTNDIHIECVKERMGRAKFERFKNCFEFFYLSYEMGMRKPDAEIFEFVVQEQQLEVRETLFIDDSKDNTDTASQLGLQVWNLQVGQEEVTELKGRFDV